MTSYFSHFSGALTPIQVEQDRDDENQYQLHCDCFQSYLVQPDGAVETYMEGGVIKAVTVPAQRSHYYTHRLLHWKRVELTEEEMEILRTHPLYEGIEPGEYDAYVAESSFPHYYLPRIHGSIYLHHIE